jgi:hypothetical protein
MGIRFRNLNASYAINAVHLSIEYCINPIFILCRFAYDLDSLKFSYLPDINNCRSFCIVIPAKAGHEVKLFSAVQEVNMTLWIPASAGITLEAFHPAAPGPNRQATSPLFEKGGRGDLKIPLNPPFSKGDL